MATVRKAQDTHKTETRNAASITAVISPHDIAARAYEIWQASGRPDGRDQEHWFQAERELRGAQHASRASRR